MPEGSGKFWYNGPWVEENSWGNKEGEGLAIAGYSHDPQSLGGGSCLGYVVKD